MKNMSLLIGFFAVFCNGCAYVIYMVGYNSPEPEHFRVIDIRRTYIYGNYYDENGKLQTRHDTLLKNQNFYIRWYFKIEYYSLKRSVPSPGLPYGWLGSFEKITQFNVTINTIEVDSLLTYYGGDSSIVSFINKYNNEINEPPHTIIGHNLEWGYYTAKMQLPQNVELGNNTLITQIQFSDGKVVTDTANFFVHQ